MVTPTKGKSISERPSHHTLASVNERRKNSKDAVVLSLCGSMSSEERGHFYIGVILGPLEGTYHMSPEVFWNPWDRPRYDLDLQQVSGNWAQCCWAGLVITKCPLQDKLNIHYHHQDILPSLTTLLCYVVMVKTSIGGANQILIQWRWRLNIQWFQFNVYFTVLWRVLNHVIQKHFCEQQQTSVEFRFGLSLI